MAAELSRSEIVVALTAPLGTDLTPVCDELRAQFRAYQYESHQVRISKLIREHPVGSPLVDASTPGKEAESLMDAGTAIRKAHRNGDAMALLAIADIEQYRPKRTEPTHSGVAFLVRSLKHPGEVRRLREVYGHGAIIIAVHSGREARLSALVGKRGLARTEAEKLMDKDQAELDELGQRTRDVFEIADAFVSADSGDQLRAQIERLMHLLFGHPFQTPTRDEHAMFLAFATAMRSADPSRQVGAIVLNHGGEVVGLGSNDVPKAGGGLYCCEDDPDRRDFRLGYESNQREKDVLASRVLDHLGLPNSEENRGKLKDAGLFDLTEYGRAVHAEMDALLSCVRVGVSVVNGTLYSTTYPCHNCAKHIIAAGIRRIVYVEPYPKSRAVLLHGDELGPTRVRVEPFIGVGPRRYVAFFSMHLAGVTTINRKDKSSGQPVRFLKSDAALRFPMERTSYLEREVLACKELLEKTEALTAKPNDVNNSPRPEGQER